MTYLFAALPQRPPSRVQTLGFGGMWAGACPHTPGWAGLRPPRPPATQQQLAVCVTEASARGLQKHLPHPDMTYVCPLQELCYHIASIICWEGWHIMDFVATQRQALLPLRAQADLRNAWLRERLDTILPELMERE